jgi:hypothetical protein
LGKVQVRHRDDERQRLILLNRLNANLNMIARWANIHKSEAEAVQVHGLPCGCAPGDRPLARDDG